MSTNKIKRNIGTIVITFLIGAVVGTLGTAVYARQQMDSMKGSNTPVKYTEAVQFMIEHPDYANRVKTKYDNYMKAAQEAFLQGLDVEDQGKE